MIGIFFWNILDYQMRSLTWFVIINTLVNGILKSFQKSLIDGQRINHTQNKYEWPTLNIDTTLLKKIMPSVSIKPKISRKTVGSIIIQYIPILNWPMDWSVFDPLIPLIYL